MPETALAQRRRLGRELYALRQHTPGVNPATGKRLATKKVNNVTTETEIQIEQTEAGGNFAQLPADTYDGWIDNIEVVPNPFEGEGATQLQCTFATAELQNEDGTPATKRAWANPVFNPSSKLYKWTVAITGEKPAPGEPFRASTIIKKPCRFVVADDTSKAGDPITKIVAVMAPKEKATPKKPGLVTRLREEQPENVNQDMGPCISCGGPADQFTGKGKPICADCK